MSITIKTTGLPEILSDLARMPNWPRMDRGLGLAILDAVVAGIMESCSHQEDPDGNAWPDLSPAYEEWKSFQFPGQEMGHLHDVMLSPDQFVGERSFSPDRAEMVYGTDAQARQEIAWFADGGREFYGVSTASAQAADGLVDVAFAKAW